MARKERDMYLPTPLLVFGIILIIGACVCLALTFTVSVYLVIGTAILLPLGIAAILCWNNQSARITGEDEFIYKTMFGKEYTCRFSQIREMKVNSDSFTLILDSCKVHIESMAVMSERFSSALDAAVKRIGH